MAACNIVVNMNRRTVHSMYFLYTARDPNSVWCFMVSDHSRLHTERQLNIVLFSRYIKRFHNRSQVQTSSATGSRRRLQCLVQESRDRSYGTAVAHTKAHWSHLLSASVARYWHIIANVSVIDIICWTYPHQWRFRVRCPPAHMAHTQQIRRGDLTARSLLYNILSNDSLLCMIYLVIYL